MRVKISPPLKKGNGGKSFVHSVKGANQATNMNPTHTLKTFTHLYFMITIYDTKPYAPLSFHRQFKIQSTHHPQPAQKHSLIVRKILSLFNIDL